MLALGRHVLCGATFAGLALVAPRSDTRNVSGAQASYWVTVRQIDGNESVPAHLLCRVERRCTGEMAVSIPGGTLRVFVIALIDGGAAFVRFRADRRNIACASHDFVTISLGPPPTSGSDYAHLCDAPPARDEPEPAAEPAVLRGFPELAALRIDARSRMETKHSSSSRIRGSELPRVRENARVHARHSSLRCYVPAAVGKICPAKTPPRQRCTWSPSNFASPKTRPNRYFLPCGPPEQSPFWLEH